MRSSVDLPQPEGPSTATVSPLRTAKSTSFRTTRSWPASSWNDLETPIVWAIGASASDFGCGDAMALSD